ncbi:MAG: hypothetical protein ACRD1X_13940, partial [Vicinamibacteria bacterium]
MHVASIPLFLLLTAGVTAQSSDNDDKASAPTQQQPSDEEGPPAVAVLGSTGLRASSADGRYVMNLWFRGQFRYAYPFDASPTTAEGFEAPSESSFSVRRARVKLGGNVYQTWLKYYFEYDLPSNQLLDAQFTLSRIPWLELTVGQWKATYNRERVD